MSGSIQTILLLLYGADSQAAIFSFADNLDARLVCKDFRKYQCLAMQKIWRDASKMLEDEGFSLPGAPSLYESEQEIKDSLKIKMNTIVPANDVPGDERIIGCFKSLLKKQSQEMPTATLQSAFDAFERVQLNYQNTLSFNRFIDNERIIHTAKREVDKNLVDVWQRAIYPNPNLGLGFLLGNPPPSAIQIRGWMNDPANEPFLHRPIQWLVLESSGGLTHVPKRSVV